MPPSNRISSFSKLLTNCLLLRRLLLLSFTLGLPGSLAIRCLNCRTLENQLVCDDPCEGDICALWSYREMSTEHIVQGCLTGPDLRSGLRMGCRRNRVDALLCLCNANDHCNQDQPTVLASEPSEQPMLPSDIRCQSRTSASFMRRQTIRPPRHSCHSDLCFFTQSNSTAIPADDPLGQPLATESTTSRNCGPQLEFNFDLLLGPVWPGHGLHSEACYRLETGRDLMIGCSCSNNDCNREMPYPIIEDGGRPPLVKCFLGPVKHTVQAKLSQRPAGSARGVPEHVPESLLSTPPPYCRGHFCFVQRETFHGYGDHWTSGCLSANESAARARLRAGYRNILGVEQWLCATELCNESMLRASEEARRRAEGGVGRTVDGPVAVGRGKTPAGGKAEGGRVLAQKQAAAKKRKELAGALLLAQAEPKRKRMPGNGAAGMARTSSTVHWLHLFTSVIIAFPALFELIHFRNLNLC